MSYKTPFGENCDGNGRLESSYKIPIEQPKPDDGIERTRIMNRMRPVEQPIERIEAGDTVTAQCWNGDSAVVERITGEGQGKTALFVGGGFWRCSRLKRIEAKIIDIEQPKQLEAVIVVPINESGGHHYEASMESMVRQGITEDLAEWFEVQLPDRVTIREKVCR